MGVDWQNPVDAPLFLCYNRLLVTRQIMNPSIVILKTGEQIICDLKEFFDSDKEDKKGLGLLFVHPYSLQLIPTEDDVQVKFSKWCPYSSDTQFKVPYDSVIAFGECDTGLREAFVEKVQQVEAFLTMEKEKNDQGDEV